MKGQKTQNSQHILKSKSQVEVLTPLELRVWSDSNHHSVALVSQQADGQRTESRAQKQTHQNTISKDKIVQYSKGSLWTLVHPPVISK
jgi:hypothetical protein